MMSSSPLSRAIAGVEAAEIALHNVRQGIIALAAVTKRALPVTWLTPSLSAVPEPVSDAAAPKEPPKPTNIAPIQAPKIKSPQKKEVKRKTKKKKAKGPLPPLTEEQKGERRRQRNQRRNQKRREVRTRPQQVEPSIVVQQPLPRYDTAAITAPLAFNRLAVKSESGLDDHKQITGAYAGLQSNWVNTNVQHATWASVTPQMPATAGFQTFFTAPGYTSYFGRDAYRYPSVYTQHQPFDMSVQHVPPQQLPPEQKEQKARYATVGLSFVYGGKEWDRDGKIITDLDDHDIHSATDSNQGISAVDDDTTEEKYHKLSTACEEDIDAGEISEQIPPQSSSYKVPQKSLLTKPDPPIFHFERKSLAPISVPNVQTSTKSLVTTPTPSIFHFDRKSLAPISVPNVQTNTKNRVNQPRKNRVGYKDGDVVGEAAPEIDINNKGRAMLMKMGWTSGTGLGAVDNKGILHPVAPVIKTTKSGLR